MQKRHRNRFHRLVREHAHSVNPAVTGPSALTKTARQFAATKAMSRFLNHEKVTLPALIEPAQEAVRKALRESVAAVVLVVHDWCMFSFNTHTGKKDKYQRSGPNDCGYELGSALVVDAADGRPLGPMEFRLRTAEGTLSTRPGDAIYPTSHVDELADVMRDARRWNLGKPIVHVIDREADSVGHYRRWQAAGHTFVVRADDNRVVTWNGQVVKLPAIAAALIYRDVLDADGQPLIVTTSTGVGRVQVAEAAIVLHRPAKVNVDGKKTEVPGPPLPVRLVVTRVVDALGVVLAEWLLFTNAAAEFDAPTIGRWYAWRWRIETFHKLLKSAGQNAEKWEQETGEAFAKRLVVAAMACLTVWHLQRDPSPEAAEFRALLIRLSGRQMKRGVPETAPALLAGLEKLLTIVNLLETYNLADVLALARRVLPTLFSSA